MKNIIYLLIISYAIFSTPSQLWSSEQKDQSVYWVGGSGYWSDFFNHWANSSGGDPREFGKVPDAGDTVIVDDNSFLPGEDVLTITIDDNAECFTLDFTSASKKVIFTKSSSAKLSIYGSLLLNSTMDLNITGALYFEALSKGHIIRSAGKTLPHLYFYGSGGGWELDGNLVCGQIYHHYGYFDAKGFDMNIQNLLIYSDSEIELNLRNSTITSSSDIYFYSKLSSFYSENSTFILNGKSTIFYSGDNTFHNVIFANPGGRATLRDGGSYNLLHFSGNGNIIHNSTFDTLSLSAGYIYESTAQSTQTINEKLISIGNCREYIFIKSADNESTFTIENNADNLEAEYTIFHNTEIKGKRLEAQNSIDLGGNSNCNIIGPMPKTLYWVGKGKAYWDDSANWDIIPGGSGGQCLPSPLDDVVFENIDPSSEVVVRTATVFCKSMLWKSGVTGVKFSNEGNFSIRIYGSLELAEDMDYQMNNLIRFESAEIGNYIKTNKQILKDILFAGKGAWHIADDLTCNLFHHYNGSIYTNSFTLNVQTILSEIPNNKEMFLGSSLVKIRNNGYFYSTYKTFDAGTSTLDFVSVSPTLSHSGLTFYNVFFTNKQGTASLHSSGTFHHVLFKANAEIRISNVFDTLAFSPGYIYDIYPNTRQTINHEIEAIGNCREYIFIKCFVDENTFSIYKDGEKIEMDYVILRNTVAEGNAGIIAENSIDLGNNLNCQIISPAPRVLYWVGKGKSYWDDSANWDISPDGGGGQCIPTPVDDVIFRDLSETEQVVIRTPTVFCKSMLWENSCVGASFSGEGNYPMRIYGGLELSPYMDYKLNNSLHFSAFEKGYSIKTDTHKLGSVLFNGLGAWDLQSDFNCKNFTFNNGNIDTKGKTINIDGFFQTNHDNQKELYLRNSNISVKGSANLFGSFGVFSAGNSTIYMQGRNISFHSSGNRLHNIYFENNDGLANLLDGGTFNKVVFKANAYFNSSFVFDTLEFSPGYTYRLIASSTQQVRSSFQARGNSCFPVFISSTLPTTQATIQKESGVVSCDFLSLTGIKATGGATFYAGGYTKAIGNLNEGWIFGNAPGYIYGFGPDTILCAGDILNTFNFNGAKSYLWHDGTTESSHTIDRSGLYWVVVTYGDNCQYADSINIEIISNAFVDLGEDIVVCEKFTRRKVNGKIRDGISPYQIFWEPEIGVSNPNSANVILSAEFTTDYVMNVVSMNGCIARDTIRYMVVETFVPVISKVGNSLKSNSSFGNQWYLNGIAIEGANEQTLIPWKSGDYTVVVIDKNGCRSLSSAPHRFNEAEFGLPAFIVERKQAFAGDLLSISIYLSNKEDFLKRGITKIDADLQYNPSLLLPQAADGIILDDRTAYIALRDISIESEEDNLLARFEFNAALGNSEYCNIPLKNLSIESNIQYLVFDGHFTLLGVCREGGSRLLNTSEKIGIRSIAPNPAGKTINVAISIAEEGNTRLLITDISGREVLNVYSGNISSIGEKVFTIDVSNLPQGSYNLILVTPNTINSEKIQIVR